MESINEAFNPHKFGSKADADKSKDHMINSLFGALTSNQKKSQQERS